MPQTFGLWPSNARSIFDLLNKNDNANLRSMPFWSKKKVKIKNMDGPVSEISDLLYLDPKNETPSQDFFNIERMNFSIESLEHLMAYLDKIRSLSLPSNQMSIVIIRTGAYLGEVLRNNCTRGLSWTDFASGAEDSEFIKNLGMSINTALMLKDSKQYLFPMAKVQKYLHSQESDDLTHYAITIIRMS